MRYLIYILIIVALFWLDLCSGSTGWKSYALIDLLSGNLSETERVILMKVRMPGAVTALLMGAALALVGLKMQVLFDNPLAGPGVMGVSSGASLFVSMAMLSGIGSSWGVAGMAVLGALLTLVLILSASIRMRSNTSLLILGLMVGYIASSLVTVIQYSAAAEALQRFVFWSMGSFQTLSWATLKWMAPLLILLMLVSFASRRHLDIMLLGEHYAESLGARNHTGRVYVLLIAGLITGLVTAYCGPLAFIGLAGPHIARMLTRTDIHVQMIPHTIFVGGAIGLLSQYVVSAPWHGMRIPLNAVLSLFGAPVVIWLLVSKSHISQVR